MKDVARESGVSPATVSFVLNSTRGQTIPEQTQQRVRDAADRLGYSPHRIARALREGTSRTVLLSTGPVPRAHSLESFIDGLDDGLRDLGYVLLVTQRTPAPELLEAVAPRVALDLATAYADGKPTVWEGGRVHGLASHAHTQLRHLTDFGHTRIALAVPKDAALAPIITVRLAQMRDAAARLGVGNPPLLAVGATRESAREALIELQREHPTVSAIAAFDDDTAMLVLAAMSDVGLSAPGDLAVIGFDEGHHAALWRPALTTVRIDAYGYGQRIARTILDEEPDAWPQRPSAVIRRDTT